MATRARKILMGCGIGCVGLIVLSIGACVSFSVWVNQPGELLEPTRVLGRETTGYIEWELKVEDPGTEEFVESLIGLQERLQARNPQRGPSWLTELIKSNQKKNNAQAVRQLLPTVAAWTISPGQTDDTDVHLFTLSIKSLGNRSRFLDLMLRYTVGLKHSVKHADERIYSADDFAMFIRDNGFFVTNSEANARLVVDRMRGEIWEMNRDPTALEIQIGALPDDRPLRGAISNSRGELWRTWKNVADPEFEAASSEIWNAIRSATLTGGFTGQTAFEGAIDFQGPDAEWARANADDLLGMLRSGFGDGHLQARLEAEALNDTVRVSFRIDDMFAFIDEL